MKWLTLVFVFFTVFANAQRSQVILPNKAFKPTHTRNLNLQQQLIEQPLYTKLSPMEQELYYFLRQQWQMRLLLNSLSLVTVSLVNSFFAHPWLRASYASSILNTEVSKWQGGTKIFTVLK